ncbi:MAG TPA: M1 family aminopeptidase [Gemmatimonadales bacterium]|nr:M1 family aminopeptidase [Gemmatimonadales bacterium]
MAALRLAPLALAAASLAASLAAAAPGTLAAQQPARPVGQIGRYVPPRDWPLRRHAFDLLHQRIAVAFDIPKRLLTGAVTTRLVVQQPTDTVRLDAGNLTIDAATAGADARGRKLPFTFDTTHVTVRLPRRAAAGDTVAFTLRYHTVPERGLYLVPRAGVVWSQGEATETRNWVPTYDAANDKTTWEFLVTADTAMQVLSNGRLVDVKPAGKGTRVWHWSQEEPASTYLYSVVAGPFAILRDQWRGRPVEYWVARDTVLAAWRSFGETPSMIELYSQLLGVPFPWAKYDQAVIPDFTYGGMENVSATTQTDLALHSAAAEPEQSTRGLDAHELAHQWFGDLTTAADWAHIWLNEGLTTYMESVQQEKTRGRDAAALNWWGQQQQAMQADVGDPRPLVWGQYEGDDPIVLFFSGHVYPKGAQLAHQLRRLLGDSLFWAGMHRFLVDNAHQPVTTADYAAAMEKTANRDLDWFFDQWAYGIGYPKVQVTRRWDAGARTLNVTVRQTQPIDAMHPLFRFPTTIRVITRDSVVRREITVSKVEETFPIPLPGAPLSFRFDEGGWLLGTVATDQTPAELAELAKHDLDILARNWALRTLEGSRDSAAIEARRFMLLNEHDATLRAEAARQLTDASAPSRRVVASALRDPASQVRAAALGSFLARDAAAGRDTALRMYREDPSLTVQMAALTAYAAAAGAAATDELVRATRPGLATPLRGVAVRQLAKLGGSAPAAEALARLTDPAEPRDLRTAALTALVQVDPARATQVAAGRLGDYDPLFAVAAVQAVAKAGGAEGRATLERAARSETRVTVQHAIRDALAPKAGG